MKVTESKSTTVSLDNSCYTNTYISNGTGETEFKFSDYTQDGSEFRLAVNVPIETARAILSELQQDIENYDAFQAKQAKEKAEKEAAEDSINSVETED